MAPLWRTPLTKPVAPRKPPSFSNLSPGQRPRVRAAATKLIKPQPRRTPSSPKSLYHERMDYRSAHDLPSFVELRDQLKGLKALQFLIPKDQRPDINELERQLRHMGDTVDNFYHILGPRNWIFHDSLPIDYIADLLASKADPSDVEAGLVAHYNDSDNLPFMVRGLNGLPALRKRQGLLIRAQDDYFCERFYACIHVLLSVMDGFVNEFETVRRGLHAREAEELKAWDSVVGHHMGLTSAHKTFTRAKSATSEEPIFELYRNGIVHGSQLNYDNVIVATKAWNRLFAVADWANSTLKQKQPAPTHPSWKELVTRIAETDRISQANAAWQPSQLLADAERFLEHPLVIAADQFLRLWEQKNYGQMAQAISAAVQAAYKAAMPRQIRLQYEPHDLIAHEITMIDHVAPAAGMITAELTMADGTKTLGRMRWIHEDNAGNPMPSSLAGEWRLRVWGPDAFLGHR